MATLDPEVRRMQRTLVCLVSLIAMPVLTWLGLTYGGLLGAALGMLLSLALVVTVFVVLSIRQGRDLRHDDIVAANAFEPDRDVYVPTEWTP